MARVPRDTTETEGAFKPRLSPEEIDTRAPPQAPAPAPEHETKPSALRPLVSPATA
jgi:hypothetical protein